MRSYRDYNWEDEPCFDLHANGIHYHDPINLPEHLSPEKYMEYLRLGLTPPNSLPFDLRGVTRQKIEEWINLNFFKLEDRGLSLLGNELNLQDPSEFQSSEIRVLIFRLSTYRVCAGSFSQFIVSEFIKDYEEGVFFDYAYAPEAIDYSNFIEGGIPLLFGSITKRPLWDFDIIIASHQYPIERFRLAPLLLWSGIPLFRWERYDKSLPYYERCPIVSLAGFSSLYCESILGDNPVKGVGQNAFVDHILMGEGELQGLEYLNRYKYFVKRGCGRKEDFLDSLENLDGFYDPTKVYYKYGNKGNIKFSGDIESIYKKECGRFLKCV